MTEKECKVTARIEKGLYHTIQDKFYHGQQTMFFRHVFKSLKVLIQADRFNEITDYLYKGKALTLPAIDEE